MHGEKNMKLQINILLLSLCVCAGACAEGDESQPMGGSETAGVEGGASGGAEAGATAGTMAGVNAGTAAGTASGEVAGSEAGATAGIEAGTTAGTVAGGAMSVGCGDETFFGRCDGTSLIYCDETNDVVITADCAEGNSETISLSCALIDDQYGYDCQAAVGSVCYLDDGPSLCAGENSGCILSQEESMSGLTSSCVESLEVCNPDDYSAEDDRAVCYGDYLYIGCTIAQPWAFDCRSFGGSCAESACIFPEGQLCDGLTLRCAEGLTCANMEENGFGSCTSESQE